MTAQCMVSLTATDDISACGELVWIAISMKPMKRHFHHFHRVRAGRTFLGQNGNIYATAVHVTFEAHRH
jgi:hypothetical protein